MWNPSHDAMKKMAVKLLNNFERSAAADGGAWHRNAAITREWLLLLEMDDPPEARVQAFAESLDSADVRTGTTWEELVIWARKWLKTRATTK